MNNPRSRGFSLVELIVVIAVIAVIAAVIIPNVSGTNEAAKEQNAISAAGTLNMAQVQWRLAPKKADGTDCTIADWPGSGNDEGCYNCLLNYMEYSETWAAFQKRHTGFTFTFQSMSNGKMQKVILKKGDTVISY